MMKRLLLLFVTLPAFALAMAQADCFTYEAGSGNTVIIGLTEKGEAATELIIPKEVVSVQNNTFYGDAIAETVMIEDGGDPAFESGVLSDLQHTLSGLYLGNGMSVSNMHSLLLSVQDACPSLTVEIGGYKDGEAEAFRNINWLGIFSDAVRVIIPAELVADQMFGTAVVYGRFNIGDTQELKTFCGSATFLDVDDGSQFLFYVPTGLNTTTKQIAINRVSYIEAGEGVLLHKVSSSASSVTLPRVTEAYTLPSSDATNYSKNMLKGVTAPTHIDATDGDYTNMVLSAGAFHLVQAGGGTLGANRAYLQVKTADLEALASSRLTLSFEDEATGVTHIGQLDNLQLDNWYDLSGRRIENPKKGLFIHNGKKEIVR